MQIRLAHPPLFHTDPLPSVHSWESIPELLMCMTVAAQWGTQLLMIDSVVIDDEMMITQLMLSHHMVL